jgi:MFS family permease
LATDSTPAAAGLFRTVPLLMLVVACGHFNRIAISVAGSERIIPDHGVSPERMGLVYSAFLAFYTLAMLPGGWFIDRFGARRALMLWGFGSSVLVLLTAGTIIGGKSALTLWLGLLGVRALLGVVNAPLHPASAYMVFERVPWPSRSLANGLVTFAACAGIAATYTVMGTLIDRLGWPAAFVVTSGMTLTVALVWTAGTRVSTAAQARNPVRPRASADFAGLLSVLRQRSVICIALSYGAQGYFQYLFFYWIEYFFETIQKQDRSVARDYATMITLAMGIGMVCGGWLTDRVGRSLSGRMRRALVPVLGLAGSGIVFELGLLTPDPKVTLAAFTVSAALLGACEGAFWTTAVELGGRFGGTTAGLMNTVGNAGGTLSPYLTPLFSGLFAARYGEDAGWRLGMAVAGAIVIAGALLWWGVRPEASHGGERPR